MDHLLDRIRTTMPQDNPASLPREQYAAIQAFLLKANGFPAGSKPLDSRSEYLTGIRWQNRINLPRPRGRAPHAKRGLKRKDGGRIGSKN
jgi:hypothetical protein